MGLGALHTINLLEAREAARQARKELLQGLDPLEEKRKRREELRRQRLSKIRFDTCAQQYLEMYGGSWRNAKHRQQWESTLRTYVFPHMGAVSVGEINTRLVVEVLEPIWTTKTETATRIRERIERVLWWAIAHGHREGDNPARWHGHLEMMLPHPANFRHSKHHAAMPVGEVGEFFAQLKAKPGTGARALQFAILTACRSGEVLGATWAEMDLERKMWILQPERTKAGRLFRVPLSTAAMDVLRLQERRDPVLVFPSDRRKGNVRSQPMNTMAMTLALRRIQGRGVTVHGFRSSFRDWVAERTTYISELAEMALEHRVGSATENAYRRSDLLEERRRLMEDWATWCNTFQGKTVLIPSAL